MKSEQHGPEATKPAKEVKKPHSVGRGGVEAFPPNFILQGSELPWALVLQ